LSDPIKTENSAFPDDACLPPDDRMGFAASVSPGHSLLLLNSYMVACEERIPKKFGYFPE